MTSAAVVAVLGVLVAIIELGTKISDLTLSRVRKSAISPMDVRIVTIQRGSEKYPDDRQLRRYRFWHLVLALLAIYIVILGGQSYGEHSRILGGFLICEGLFLFIVGVQGAWRLRNARAGQPLQAVSIEVGLAGQKTEVMQDCLNAMVNVGALRAKGTHIHECQNGDISIQGGTGAWPRNARGNRVTILITSRKPLIFNASISSHSYRPGLLDSYWNTKNVTKILQQLIVSASVKSVD